MEKATKCSALLAVFRDPTGCEQAHLRALIDFSVWPLGESSDRIPIVELARAGRPILEVPCCRTRGYLPSRDLSERLEGSERSAACGGGPIACRAVNIVLALGGPETASP